MPYWTSETLRERSEAEDLISPFDAEKIKHSAYELTMGPEAFITSSDGKKKITLDEEDSVVIPPGQFALLLTEERIKVPLNAIAFISMRFGFKRRGLINVSGFHVDPGFGVRRLKFSVYNAGSRDITISRGDRVFLIWFADLNETTKDGYGDPGPDQDKITSDDQNVMHGEIASPAELKLQLDTLKHFDVHRKWMLGVIAASLVAIAVRLWVPYFTVPSPTEIEKLQTEIREVRQEISEFEKQSKVPRDSASTSGGDELEQQPLHQGNEDSTGNDTDPSTGQ